MSVWFLFCATPVCSAAVNLFSFCCQLCGCDGFESAMRSTLGGGGGGD